MPNLTKSSLMLSPFQYSRVCVPYSQKMMSMSVTKKKLQRKVRAWLPWQSENWLSFLAQMKRKATTIYTATSRRRSMIQKHFNVDFMHVVIPLRPATMFKLSVIKLTNSTTPPRTNKLQRQFCFHSIPLSRNKNTQTRFPGELVNLCTQKRGSTRIKKTIIPQSAIAPMQYPQKTSVIAQPYPFSAPFREKKNTAAKAVTATTKKTTKAALGCESLHLTVTSPMKLMRNVAPMIISTILNYSLKQFFSTSSPTKTVHPKPSVSCSILKKILKALLFGQFMSLSILNLNYTSQLHTQAKNQGKQDMHIRLCWVWPP